jgi:site-specific DNA-cytosine methylase
MPKELRESLLISAAKSPNGTGIITRGMDEPATTIAAGGEQGDRLVTRAYLVQSKNSNQEWGDGMRPDDKPSFAVVTDHKPSHMPRAYLVHPTDMRTMPIRDETEPAFTILTDQKESHQPRAYLIGGGNTGFEKVSSHARAADEPAFTLRDGRNGSPERAWLFGDQSQSAGEGVQVRADDEPAPTVRSGWGGGAPPRIYAGRWVRLTVQALGRFQTVPDDYRGLTSEINGNGVPSLLSQRIMESLM